MMIKAATEAGAGKPLFKFRNYGQQLPHRCNTISNEAAFGTAYVILMAMAQIPAGGIHRWLVDAAPPVQRAKRRSRDPMSANGAWQR
jgi:hypothetical protein